MDRTDAALKRLTGGPMVVTALSIKTDPSRELAARVRARGWWAEAISLAEVAWALETGFPAEAIVLNGPAGPGLLSRSGEPLAAVFADSTEGLARLSGSDSARVIGVRLRLPSTPSRFGIDVSDHSLFSRTLHHLRPGSGRRYGVHFHLASDVWGPERWLERADEAIRWTQVIADGLGQPPELFDLGGGWHHEDWNDILLPALTELQPRIATALPGVRRIILEPGKAISGPTAVLRTQIIEVRERPGGVFEVVVNASIADLPMARLYAHPMALVRQGRPLGRLSGGVGRVLGSICMESDVLADGVAFPVTPRPGDELVIGDAGGYNASMSWHFGAGVGRDG